MPLSFCFCQVLGQGLDHEGLYGDAAFGRADPHTSPEIGGEIFEPDFCRASHVSMVTQNTRGCQATASMVISMVVSTLTLGEAESTTNSCRVYSLPGSADDGVRTTSPVEVIEAMETPKGSGPRP